MKEELVSRGRLSKSAPHHQQAKNANFKLTVAVVTEGRILWQMSRWPFVSREIWVGLEITRYGCTCLWRPKDDL